jgi:pimeloyl-ACP methyl ester carboxylesterase
MESATDRAIVLNDGRTLGYAEYGDPMGAPIMLFHGTPCSRLAGVIVDRVARDHQARIFVADRPGYATSSPVRHGSLIGFVDEIDALANALHLDSFTLLGVSGGGPFALGYSAKFPKRVNRCALMSTIGPLALPHSIDDMVSVNRTNFRLARFLPALPGLLVPR